jgi:hypothetical protein
LIFGGKSHSGTRNQGGIVIDPTTLFDCLRNRNPACGGYPVHRAFRIETFGDEQACGQQTAPTDSLSAMDDCVPARHEIGVDFLQGCRQFALRVRHSAVRDGQRGKFHASRFDLSRFPGEIEILFFVGGKQRKHSRNASLLPPGDFIFQPVTSPGT